MFQLDKSLLVSVIVPVIMRSHFFGKINLTFALAVFTANAGI
ncbi:hypothetical protein [Chlorogloeopsis fritschii]|jgi:hypothetical protein|nr:hypothetical protein [Chlorogloeopsis fritschii]